MFCFSVVSRVFPNISTTPTILFQRNDYRLQAHKKGGFNMVQLDVSCGFEV